MSLKSFIIASILIHLVGGIALYFYYNPIVLDSKPTPFEKEELKKPMVEENQNQKTPEKENLKESTATEFKTEKLAESSQPLKLDKKEGKLAEAQNFRPLEESFTENQAEENPQEELEQRAVPTNKEEFAKETAREKSELSQNPQEKQGLKENKHHQKKEVRDFSILKQRPENPPLSYPDFARKLNMEGTVILLFFVDERGLVEKMQMEKSSGHLELDNFVLRALARYQFLENQSGWVRFKKTFILKGEEKEYLRLRQEEDGEFAEEKIESFEEDFVEEGEKTEGKAFPKGREEESAEKELEPKPEKIEFIDYENLEELEPNPSQEEKTLAD